VTRPTATRADRGLESGRLAPLDFDVSSSFFTTSFDSLSKSSVVERERNKISISKHFFLEAKRINNKLGRGEERNW